VREKTGWQRPLTAKIAEKSREGREQRRIAVDRWAARANSCYSRLYRPCLGPPVCGRVRIERKHRLQ